MLQESLQGCIWIWRQAQIFISAARCVCCMHSDVCCDGRPRRAALQSNAPPLDAAIPTSKPRKRLPLSAASRSCGWLPQHRFQIMSLRHYSYCERCAALQTCARSSAGCRASETCRPCAAREAAAKLCGLAAAGQSGADASALLQQLAAVFTAAGGTGASRPGASGGAPPENSSAAAGRAAARYEERDGATAACGYVLAQTMTGALTLRHLLACRDLAAALNGRT